MRGSYDDVRAEDGGVRREAVVLFYLRGEAVERGPGYEENG